MHLDLALFSSLCGQLALANLQNIVDVFSYNFKDEFDIDQVRHFQVLKLAQKRQVKSW
jgi:hypothetical protein